MQTTAVSVQTSSVLGVFLQFVRQRWIEGIRCRSHESFALCASLIWVTFYNARFWQDTVHAMWHGTPTSLIFLVSLFALVLSLQALLLLLLPSRRLMLAATSAFFLLAAATSYFSMKFGAVMDKDMLRNVFETDAAEAQALLSGELLVRMGVMGLLPALLVWKVRLPHSPWSQHLRRRALAIIGLLGVSLFALLSSAASYAVFFREHKPIRFVLTPAAPVSSALGLMVDENHRHGGPLINASGATQHATQPNARPVVLVLVVGETARAANFQLGGYARATTPRLAATDGVVYFSAATSCATSTAVSVPCLFSHLPRSQFDVDDADHYANLLDALQSASIDVEWRENNAGCKGVCARAHPIVYAERADSKFCRGAGCYDEVLLEDLPAKLADVHRDTVIVMHQMGSHGPAYTERYPAEFERFKPACRSNQLQRCTAQEVVNAYDNTIAYTDHVLAQTIAALREASNHVDTMLLYVSDHGESLGEQGLYLHGLPYAFAPATQTHVPMLLWLSSAYAQRGRIDTACLGAHTTQPVSHDNVYHTVLGATEVRNRSYEHTLDLLAPCRARALPIDHE